MTRNDRSDDGVEATLERAQRALDESTSYRAEAEALKAQLAAYMSERRKLEAPGAVPRAVRRRGERLLEDVAALLARPKPAPAVAETPDKGHKSRRKLHQDPRVDREDVPPEPIRPTRLPGRSHRGRD